MTPVVTFFNNKGGVGKTSLVYHLSWMYAQLGVRVLAVDLDPQANLTAAFLGRGPAGRAVATGQAPQTVYGTLLPLLRGTGDIGPPHLLVPDERQVLAPDDGLALAPGDLALSRAEDELSRQWPACAR